MALRTAVVGTATIRTHLQNIYAKLLVADRSSAVAAAMRLGIIDELVTRRASRATANQRLQRLWHAAERITFRYASPPTYA